MFSSLNSEPVYPLGDEWINTARNTQVLNWAEFVGDLKCGIDVMSSLQIALESHDAIFLRGSVGNDLKSFFADNWTDLSTEPTLIALTASLETQLWVASCWFEESATFLNLDWTWISFDLGLADLTEEFLTEGIRGMFGGSQR